MTRVKRFLSVCLAFCFILVLLLTPLAVPAESVRVSAAVSGDVDGDGRVSTSDVRLLMYHIIGIAPLNEWQLQAADFDADSTISSWDPRDMLCAIADTAPPVAQTTTTTVSGGATTTTTITTTTVPFAPLDQTQYYGRQLLAAESADLAEAYDYLGEQVQAMNPEIAMWMYGLSVTEFERVLRYYHDDHPEAFWLNLSYSYSYWTQNGTSYVYMMYQNYLYTASQVRNLKTKLETRTAQLLEGIDSSTPVAERVRLVHNRLILSSKYDTSYAAAHTHDLAGVMLNGVGVCESYARAFQYLMYRCGINAIVQIGEIKANSEDHMWNLVQINNEWYQMDLTWDDPIFEEENPRYVRFHYYNTTTAKVKQERTIYRAKASTDSTYYVSYPYPDCTATAENYYIKHAIGITTYNKTTIANEVARSILEGEQAVFRPVGTYTFAKLQSAIEKNIHDICAQANTLLPTDLQIKKIGYFIEESASEYGVLTLFVRDYS